MGRIAELLTEHESDGPGIVVIDVFAVAATRHDRFGMPYLIRHQVNASFVIVDVKVCFITVDVLDVNVNLNRPGY